MSIFSNLFTGKKNTNSVIPVLPSDIYGAATIELQDILAPSAVEINSGFIKIGDKIAKSYFTMSYPKFLTEGWLAPIINLDKIFDVSIHVSPINTAVIMKEFQKKVAEVQSQIYAKEKSGMVRDPQLDMAYQNLEQLRDSLQQASEKMFSVGLYFTIYATNESELFKVENEIRSQLEAQMIYLKPALFQQEQGFITGVPLGLDNLGIINKLNTGPLSSFFPFAAALIAWPNVAEYSKANPVVLNLSLNLFH